MKTVLCLTDSLRDIHHFVQDATLQFFKIEQLEPGEHSFLLFEEIYKKLKKNLDLTKVDLIIAEYIEAIPLVYFMRKEGIFSPALFIPHTNAYPFNILFYFLSIAELSHPDDRILCGSTQAAIGYESLTSIKAIPCCTFGIKDYYEEGNQQKARELLGLPLDKKILLFTGRFMNDKGLMPLLEAYEKLRSKNPNILLVISSTHLDPFYFNQCAPKMGAVILFYRLENERIKYLYQAADLFVSGATSVFETYGKSPLEAIASNLPAILPNWDGFSYFIDGNNGDLVKVNFTGPVEESPYSFARVDVDDLAEKTQSWLMRKKENLFLRLPQWAFYNETMSRLSALTKDLLKENRRYQKKIDQPKFILFDRYPGIIKKICGYYGIHQWVDFEVKAQVCGLINRENPGHLPLLQELHNFLFKKMEETEATIFSEGDQNFPTNAFTYTESSLL